jgi:hypothetical protein
VRRPDMQQYKLMRTVALLDIDIAPVTRPHADLLDGLVSLIRDSQIVDPSCHAMRAPYSSGSNESHLILP